MIDLSTDYKCLFQRARGEASDPLQSDAVVFVCPSGGMCRGGSHPDQSIRRQNIWLVCSAQRHEAICSLGGPRRAQCDQDLQLLQEIWLQNASDGRLLPQQESNCCPRRLWLAHHKVIQIHFLFCQFCWIEFILKKTFKSFIVGRIDKHRRNSATIFERGVRQGKPIREDFTRWEAISLFA